MDLRFGVLLHLLLSKQKWSRLWLGIPWRMLVREDWRLHSGEMTEKIYKTQDIHLDVYGVSNTRLAEK